MKCESFQEWLENRDIHDLSEADKAQRHAVECVHCAELMKKDEQLDHFIAGCLRSTEIPPAVKNLVDLSLDRATPRRGKKSFLSGLVACAMVVLAVIVFRQDEQPRFAAMDEMGRYMQADHLDHSNMVAKFERVSDSLTWLTEKAGFSVEPPQLLLAGYSVVGARFCQLGHCKAVHMIYEKDGKLVSLFVIDDDELDFPLERNTLHSLTISDNSVSLYRKDGKVFALVT